MVILSLCQEEAYIVPFIHSSPTFLSLSLRFTPQIKKLGVIGEISLGTVSIMRNFWLELMTQYTCSNLYMENSMAAFVNNENV